jgi:hypothetical protein
MSTLSVATIKSQNTLPPAVQNSSGTEIGTFCRAWVNFNGTGTVAIRASFNVSSITDNGTGDYTVNFTTAMSDANYCIVRSTSNNSGTPDFYPPADLGTITASSVRFITGYISNFTADGVAADVNNIHVAIFR